METPPRLFLLAPDWTPTVKPDESRQFCHRIRPGEDSYHRILPGELYFHKDITDLCLPCAFRAEIITTKPPQMLREPASRPAPRMETSEPTDD